MESTELAGVDQGCLKARALVVDFVSGSLAVHAQARMRAHLAHCENCFEHYRSTISGIAALGRPRTDSARSSALPGVAPRLHTGLVRWPRAPGRLPSLSALGLLLVLGAGLFLVRAQSAHVWRLVSVEGVISLDGNTDPASQALAELTVERWCVLEAGAVLQAELGEARVDVYGPARFVFEQAEGARLRVEQGQFALQGPLQLSHASAGLQLDGGRCDVRVTRTSLDVDCLSGTARLIDAGGERALAAGQSVRVP
jgi:Putative zinc-finger